MTWLRLTSIDGKHVTVNMNNIVSITEYEGSGTYLKATSTERSDHAAVTVVYEPRAKIEEMLHASGVTIG